MQTTTPTRALVCVMLFTVIRLNEIVRELCSVTLEWIEFRTFGAFINYNS